MGFGPFFGTDAFGLFDTIKGNTTHPGSNDPNNPYYQGGSGNLFADQIRDLSGGITRQQRKTRALDFDAIVMPDASGFMPYQTAGMNEFARNLFTGSSAAGAARGMVMPENYGQVVGSALTRALPNLFSIQNQNQLLPRQLAAMITETKLAPGNLLIGGGAFSRGAGTGYNNLNAATSNYWNMMNNIGSFWGGQGLAGGMGGGGGKG